MMSEVELKALASKYGGSYDDFDKDLGIDLVSYRLRLWFHDKDFSAYIVRMYGGMGIRYLTVNDDCDIEPLLRAFTGGDWELKDWVLCRG